MIANGKEIAEDIERELLMAFRALPHKKVCFVLFADSPASRQFIARKSRLAERLGIMVEVVERTDVATTEDCVDVIEEIVAKDFDGVVVQLPMPVHVDAQRVLDVVPARLDIDVLGSAAKEIFKNSTNSTESGGVELSNKSTKIPPVARAVKEILDFYKISLHGKKILIVGNGKLVGEPVLVMFSHIQKSEKVSLDMVDIATPMDERARFIAAADIIISGVGSPYMIRPEMVKEGVVLIDAGTSEQSGKLVGDIDPTCAERASLLTPVPGGVGPVTVVSLFRNLI